MLGKKEETSSKASRGRTSRTERAIFGGQMVEGLWKEKDLEGTSWKLGWYRGEVQRFDEENNVVFIWYFKDRFVYSLDATGSLVDGVIRQVNEP